MEKNNQVPVWDLTSLFASMDDPRIEETLSESLNRAKKFNNDYKGNLQKIVSGGSFLHLLTEYESIMTLAVKPQDYAELLYSVESNSHEKGAFLQKMRSRTNEIFAELIFFEIEVGEFDNENYEKILIDEKLIVYRHYFEKLQEQKKHHLSEQEEKIIEKKDLSGKQAFRRLFGKKLTEKKYKIEIDGQEKELSESEILNILYTESRQEIRAKAAKIFTDGLLEISDVLTFATNTLAEDKKNEDQLRGFEFPEDSRHLANETNRKAVGSMCTVVEKHYDLVQQYYDFKKQVLGLDKIYDYDRYAPVGKVNQKYSFEEAKEIVLDAFGEVSGEFTENGKLFFDKNLIDAKITDGKRGGAFCAPIAPDLSAPVFMNYEGSSNDVRTLAHELGHAIHFEQARKQTFLNYFIPLTLSETASIFAETIVFSKLVSITENKDELLSLYMGKIEGIFASVQRQISMFRFEQDLHAKYRKDGELSMEQINGLWINRQREMFGDSVELTEEYSNWWMYIPHFINSPFYVYAYSFGDLLALGLFEKMQKDPKVFAEKYIQFLQAGGSKSPQQLADLFEINLEDEQFWNGGMKVIEQYLTKAKELYSQK